MAEVVLANAFDANKRQFLDKHLGNMILASLIKRLERKLAIDVKLEPGKRWGQYWLPTPFLDKGYRKLGCVFIVNPDATALAPCVLFFSYMRARTDWPDAVVFTQMANVKSELGW